MAFSPPASDLKAIETQWERAHRHENHKSDPGSLSTPRMSLSANYAFFRKEPSTETIFQRAEDGENLNSAEQCVSKELKEAWRNIHPTAFNITSHYRILLVLLMKRLLEKNNLHQTLKLLMWRSALEATFSPPSNPALQPDALPRGHRATSWNTPTEMLIGTAGPCCTDQNVHFAPHPTGIVSRAVTCWLCAVVLSARGGLHYSKQAWCMWTNKQPVRARAEAGSVAGTSQREHMLTVWTPLLLVWAALLIPQRRSSKTTGWSSKRFEGSTKLLLQVLSVKKITQGPDWWVCFLKSKPQVAVRIQPSFVVQLGRCYTETRRRCKAQQLFVCVFNSSPLWNNIKPSHHPIPHWAGKGGRGGAEAETGLRWPAASRGFRDPSHQLRRDGVPQIWQNEERGP